MTADIKKQVTQIAIISGVEIVFGIVEGIVMPNLFEREFGEPYFMPETEKIKSIGTGLLITGIASGLISDTIISVYNVQDGNRNKVIIATAIAINVIETIYSYNAPPDWKTGLKLPTFKTFAPAFAFLVFTSILGGNISNYLIGSVAPSLSGAGTQPPSPQVPDVSQSTEQLVMAQ